MNREEFNDLKSQFATSSWGGRRTPPLAFTDYGVLMLSSVLKSDRAIKVNIQIIRIFEYIKQLEQEKQYNIEQQDREKIGYKRHDD